MKRYDLVVDGIPRQYFAHFPSKPVPGDQFPLVFLLHGGGGSPRSMMNLTGMNSLADRHRFVAVYPQGTGPMNRRLTWNAGHCCGFARDNGVDDVGFIRTLIEEMVTTRPVAPDRVYLIGISNGGMMTLRLGLELSSLITAIAVVAGTYLPAADQTRIDRPVPLILFHGSNDHMVPLLGGKRRSFSGVQVSHPSVEQTLQHWKKNHGDLIRSEIETAAGVRRESYLNRSGIEVLVIYTIFGGGHTWPGTSVGRPAKDDPMQQISATELIYDFFEKHNHLQS